ncbi:MAG: GGDEF domain-containing protein [Solirubrobacteraceae bacterium]|nr:GGDEF domain-containing protein [Solirubrobacteraceae bacterium]
MRSAARSGRLGWRLGALTQWLTLVAAVLVIVVMVAIAEGARLDADRYRQGEVALERVRGATEQVSAVRWEGRARDELTPGLLARAGVTILGLNQAIDKLDDGGVPTATQSALARNADELIATGRQALSLAQRGDRPATTRLDDEVLTPQVAAIEKRIAAAITEQQQAVEQSLRRTRILFGGSLLVGLLTILLLALRFEQLRRRSVIARRERAMERRGENRLRALIRHSNDLVTVIGPDGNVRWQSESIRHVLGHEPDALVGRPFTDLIHPGDVPLAQAFFTAAAERRGDTVGGSTINLRMRDGDGEWRSVEIVAENRLNDPGVDGILLNVRDVSDRLALEAQLRHQAFHDALTGLANRTLFEDRLLHALQASRRREALLAVLFLDLDDFKTINDSLGHVSGDEVLREVAERVGRCLRSADTAARLGGDEFAILLEHVHDEAEALMVAERLLSELGPPIVVDGRELSVAGSVGVAFAHEDATVDELLRNADAAMYAAKANGKNTVEVFREVMHQAALERLELTGELQRGLTDTEFELDFQPIVELQEGRIVGCETLVRWAHPRRGRLAPDEFIGVAEETGMIVPLGAWILREACVQMRRWQLADLTGDLSFISVNVSTRQLRDPEFPAEVRAALTTSGLDPACLTLEITESLLVDDRVLILQQLSQLKALGLRLAVDDFGTGYSVLSYLQQFPIDVLKIDKSFVAGIEIAPDRAKLVRGIVELGESLNLEIVAEGIERPDQAAQLRAMHGPLGQGFLYSRPLGGQAMTDLLRRGLPATIAS